MDPVADLRRDGYVVLPDLLPAAEVAAARAELAPLVADTPTGRDGFEGRLTRRVYALFAKTRALDGFATQPAVLAVLDEVLGGYLLSAPVAISIGPGAGAQPLHRDDGAYPLPRPHPEIVLTVMWPLTGFTAANGATRIVPGSHRWGSERPDPSMPTVPAEVPAGAALLYLGSLWHGGGANGTARARLGVVMNYAQGWLRPIENHTLAVPPAVAAGLPARLQELLGYAIYPPFTGYVDGRHPRTLLTP